MNDVNERRAAMQKLEPQINTMCLLLLAISERGGTDIIIFPKNSDNLATNGAVVVVTSQAKAEQLEALVQTWCDEAGEGHVTSWLSRPDGSRVEPQ